MKSGSRGHNLISVELTAEGVDAVAEAVIRKLMERGFLPAGKGGAPATYETGAIADTTLLPVTGFLRLSEVLKFIPISSTGWWRGVREGKYPASIKLSSRVTVWRAEDIRELLATIGNGAR